MRKKGRPTEQKNLQKIIKNITFIEEWKSLVKGSKLVCFVFFVTFFFLPSLSIFGLVSVVASQLLYFFRFLCISIKEEEKEEEDNPSIGLLWKAVHWIILPTCPSHKIYSLSLSLIILYISIFFFFSLFLKSKTLKHLLRPVLTYIERQHMLGNGHNRKQ